LEGLEAGNDFVVSQELVFNKGQPEICRLSFF
jgi:hypothetical protein